MRRLPREFGPLTYGVLQAGVTTGLATALAAHQVTGLGLEFFGKWLVSWTMAWLIMLPIVVLLAPVLRRAVGALMDNR